MTQDRHLCTVHHFIESPVRPCPRRGMEWSHAATTFRLTARTVSSNDPADPAQPRSTMSRIDWVTTFLVAKLNALVVTQGYYLEDAPVAYPLGKTGRGNREVDNRFPRSLSERKIPSPIQYNQVIPSDHLADQDHC